MSFKLRCLHPAAFAINMGTGTLACVTLKQASIFPALELPGKILCLFNYGLFSALTLYAAISWTLGKEEIRKHLELPGQLAFFATFGIALLVLANQSVLYGFHAVIALGFWVAGSLATFLINLAILLKSFLKKYELGHITPAFFIPVVSLVVIPFSGCPLAIGLPAFWQSLALLFCVLGIGGGLMLYAGLFAIMLQRHLLLEPLPDHLAPTLWIHLAPLGWGALGIIAFAQSYTSPETLKVVELFALFAWGAAFWWVIMAGILTLRAVCKKSMYFNMAWWSFIFPLGSFALLSKRLQFSFSEQISFCVWLLMLGLWLVSALKTLRLAFWPKEPIIKAKV